MRIGITGERGFLGRHLAARFPSSSLSEGGDLEYADGALAVACDSDVVIHLAANVGGIGLNNARPATLFHDNMLMGLNMFRACAQYKCRLICVNTVCAYPGTARVPMSESSLWDGYPEPTNAAYAMAKKMLIVQSEAYRKEFGLRSENIMLANLYGPGDNFSPTRSHVIPALIKKAVDAKRNGDKEIVLFGNGAATRDFLYVDDAVDGIIRVLDGYDGLDPINIGTGVETSIIQVAMIICDEVGFDGNISFDESKPNGQMRRVLDISKARRLLGFEPKTSLRDGIRKTVKWYNDHLSNLS